MDKIESARELLKKLDKYTDRNLAGKARKMICMQQFLVETKRQIEVQN